MAEGFASPVVNASGVLIRALMKSLNYVAGVSGWQITRDGDAEFNDVTVRGGLVVTDPDGSSITISDVPGFGPTIDLLPPAEPGHVFSAGTINAGGGPPYISITSPRRDGGQFSVFAMSGESTVGAADRLVELITDDVQFTLGGGAHRMRLAGGPLITNDPTTGVGNDETWHPFVFQNAWANGGGSAVPGKFMMVPSPANCMMIVGELVAGTKADNTVIATFTAPYRPAHNVTIPVGMNPGTAGTTTPILQLKTNGDLCCFGMAAAAAPRIYFSQLIPLTA